MPGETMREAMDHLRTDTDDLTGTTAPTPTDEELTTAVAALAGQGAPQAPRRPPPGWWVVGALAACILVADVGILLVLGSQERQALAACETTNTLRATIARVRVAEEASVPAERYDIATRTFYDRALSDLALVDCDNLPRARASLPERMPREPGQPAPPPMSGATGEPGLAGLTGAAGVAGLVGADGAPGRDGIDGVPGLAGPAGSAGRDGVDGAPGAPGTDGAPGVVGPIGPAGPEGPPAPTTTLPPTTTTTVCLLLCP